MSTLSGIAAYGVHLPYWRLTHATIQQAVGRRVGKGARTVAGYDEDTTTMAVEASRRALAGIGNDIDAVLFATTAPAYIDKTNATAVHAALGISPDARAADVGGAVRSGTCALLTGLERSGRTLVALADTRTGPSGSSDEATGGDAAAAFVVGPATESTPLIAEFLGAGSASTEFLDRWRAPGDPWSQTWEERFGEGAYTEAAARSLTNALKETGLSIGNVDKYSVTGLSPRAARSFLATSGVSPGAAVDDLVGRIGHSGAAHAGVALAAMLDTASPGQILAITVLADGADTLFFRTTDAIATARPAITVEDQIAAGRDTLSYVDFLSWRGLVAKQTPRRPDPDRAAAPASHRLVDWKYGFVGSRCLECDTEHLPPQRVCLRCGVTDRMVPAPLAHTQATVATYTIDHLAFSPAPPVVGAVIDFDGGGRFSCELTDIDPDTLQIGQRVEMTFRRLSTAEGIHNYFWKARPSADAPTAEGHRS